MCLTSDLDCVAVAHGTCHSPSSSSRELKWTRQGEQTTSGNRLGCHKMAAANVLLLHFFSQYAHPPWVPRCQESPRSPTFKPSGTEQCGCGGPTGAGQREGGGGTGQALPAWTSRRLNSPRGARGRRASLGACAVQTAPQERPAPQHLAGRGGHAPPFKATAGHDAPTKPTLKHARNT